MLQHFDNFFMLATPMNYFQKISYHAFWNKVSYFMDRFQFLIPFYPLFFTFKNTTINEILHYICIIEFLIFNTPFPKFLFRYKKKDGETLLWYIYLYNRIEFNLRFDTSIPSRSLSSISRKRLRFRGRRRRIQGFRACENGIPAVFRRWSGSVMGVWVKVVSGLIEG